jgi:hypothetical protein
MMNTAVRAGQYRLDDLLMRCGRNEKVFAFTDDVTATRKHARSRQESLRRDLHRWPAWRLASPRSQFRDQTCVLVSSTAWGGARASTRGRGEAG